MKQECNTVPYEQGSQADLVQFALICENAPLGTKVSLTSSNPESQPPIEIQPVTVTLFPSFIIGMASNVPANFSTLLTYCYTLPEGKEPPPDFSITVRASIIEHTTVEH
jgi:hypothetical protein